MAKAPGGEGGHLYTFKNLCMLLRNRTSSASVDTVSTMHLSVSLAVLPTHKISEMVDSDKTTLGLKSRNQCYCNVYFLSYSYFLLSIEGTWQR